MVRPPLPAVSVSSESMANEDHPKYRGVRKRKWGKWVSEIRMPNSRERIWLGSYDSPEKAARAFDAALFCLRGNSANFNFPDQPPNIPGGTDLHPSQIQAVAADFANSVSSSSSQDHSSSTTAFDDQSSVYYQTSSNSMDVVITSSSFFDDGFNIMNDNNNNNVNYGVNDFEIFPGFDDYFMHPLQQQPPPAADYGDEVFDSDGVYPQDSSFLWNF